MSENSAEKTKKPWIVILVAILQFLSAGAFFLLTGFSALAVVFGTVWGLDQYVADQVSRYSRNPNMSYGVTIIFGVAAALFFILFLYFLILGISLLKGKKFAWYIQVIMSVIGVLTLPLSFFWNLFTLPISAVLNIVILIFFFQPRVRGYFKV